jgi:hypothetical protein
MSQPPNAGHPHPPAPPPPNPSRASWRTRVGRGLRAHPTRNATANVAMWAVLGMIVVLFIAAGIAGPQHKTKTTAAGSTRTTAAPPSVVDTTTARSTSPPTGPSTAPRPPTAPARPVETTGGITINAAGAVLPDPRRTPGATNPAVTQATISRTICVSGWTATVRPASSYTTALKERQLASGYAYRGDTATADYEEDHLISLELGGAPASGLNLWPEPYAATDGARTKDVIENKLHSLVCSGALGLAVAQHAIAGNWWTAYLNYVGTPPAPRTSTASPSMYSPPASGTSAAGPPAGATALCNDGTYSYAAHHQGACSRHGGVKIFYH